MSNSPPFRPYTEYVELPADEMVRRAKEFHATLARRRTIREFSDRPVPKQLIEDCIAAARLAPSGANQQPWHFACVSDPEIKRKIRIAAEEEEREFYERRASDEWLNALQPFDTDANKPFLETAPWLITIFGQTYGVNPDGTKAKHYYVQESVGIATGFLIAALTAAGLGTLTHTPSPMKFLGDILHRPANERAYVLLVVGFPAENVSVPDISKKSDEETVSWHG
ncbi:MAG: nitroreductase family protein [Planctomycetaceae bacterium]